MSGELKSVASKAIEDEAADLYKVSQEIWKNPELYYQEKHAHAVLTEFFEQRGFSVEKGFKLDTAFKATYGDGSSPNIAVLCEYDALPGIGHACGHNLIAEVGAAAAIGIKAAMEAGGEKIGRLTVLGTPAEEEGGGKVDLINEGAFDDVDVAMMAHPAPHTAVNTNVLAMTELTIHFTGKASHAAAYPHQGVNALDAAVSCYQSISNMRQQMKTSCRIHGIFTNGGAKPNIIPEQSELLYYIRAATKVDLEELIAKTRLCAEGAAISTGCQVEFTECPKPYLDVLVNSTLARLYTQNCLSLGVEFCADAKLLAIPSGSTDMGNVTHVVPGFHPEFFIGTTAPCHSRPFCQAAGDVKAQPFTLTQGKALAMVAIDLMFDKNLLHMVKEDFKKDTQGEY